ncbi:MAG: regulatory protein RecX [Limnochordales bacterium]|nr:regulatory protein RecX [Limnochordales bacterium]
MARQATDPCDARAALVRALRYLGRRDRSEQEVRHYLARAGFSASVIAEVVARLVNWGYLNDRRLAEEWITTRLARGQAGKERLRHELYRRGIAAATVEEALAAISAEMEGEAALAAAERWLGRTARVDPGSGSQEALAGLRRRLWAFLIRRGYTGEIARAVVDHLLPS